MKRTPVTKTYNNPLELFEDTWKYGNRKQKEALLTSRGHSPTFAITKSVPELVKRGGGFAAKDLLHVHKEYLKRKGNTTITWR